jgi:hypothetical protein
MSSLYGTSPTHSSLGLAYDETQQTAQNRIDEASAEIQGTYGYRKRGMDTDVGGYVKSDIPRTYFVNESLDSKFDPGLVSLHELTHSSKLDRLNDNVFKVKANKYNDKRDEISKEIKEAKGEVKETYKLHRDLMDQTKQYIHDTPEVYPRIMEIRYQLGLKPDDIITPAHLDEIKKTRAYEDLKDIYYDADIITMMNRMANAETGDGQFDLPTAQYGGYLPMYQGGGELPDERQPLVSPTTGVDAKQYVGDWLNHPASQQRYAGINPKGSQRALEFANQNLQDLKYVKPQGPAPVVEGETVKAQYEPYEHQVTNWSGEFPSDVHETFHGTGIGRDPKVGKFIRSIPTTFDKKGSRSEDYPDEVYSRIMELRNQSGLSPDTTVTPEMLPQDRSNELFEHYEDKDILNMMNTLAYQQGDQGLPVAQDGGELPQYGKGGRFMGIDPAHKGYCTPMTKSTCTPRRKALARRLKPGGDLYKGKKEEGGYLPMYGVGGWLNTIGSVASVIPVIGQIAGPILKTAGKVATGIEEKRAAEHAAKVQAQRDQFAESQAVDDPMQTQTQPPIRAQDGGIIGYGFGTNPVITSFNGKSNSHAQGGINVDSLGNPTAVSKKYGNLSASSPVGKDIGEVESGEVIFNGYVFSDKLTL